MAEKKIGRVTMTATDDQLDKLTTFVTKATDLFDTRIDPFDLKVVPRADMPVAYKKDDGTIVRAEGHWSERRRLMRCADDLFKPKDTLERDKVLGHEFTHALASDWLGKWHRKQLLPLITPLCDNWDDLTIGNSFEGYVASPWEALACYGSAALFGWAKPAYASIYMRRITQEKFPKTKTLLLATAP